MPIGNLTSQIFANIYLNEFDQFVSHSLKPLAYVRYGDDFMLWCENEAAANEARTVGTQFLGDELGLNTNPKHDRVQPVTDKLPYLGIDLWPNGRRLQARTARRISERLELGNLASYRALAVQHQSNRYRKDFSWKTVDIIDQT